MKPVLLIEQEHKLAGHGVLGERLRAKSLPYTSRRAWDHDLAGIQASDFSAVVPLGSNVSVWEEDEHPFLRDERAILEAALEDEVPVLGICLGGQLLARSAGADVHAGVGQEIGWHTITTTPEAAADPLFAHANGETHVYQFHVDTFDLPPGAVRLASSELFPNQAFRVGELAWGLQFHPEIDFRQFDIWIGNHPGYCAKIGVDEAELRASVRRGNAAFSPFSRGLIDSFLEVVTCRG